jgi:hypothetical protein
VSADREPIRSYQRIFRPERRIYQLEGRSLPVPGGVPLRWLGYATAALVAVLAIGSGSTTIGVLTALAAALVGFTIGGRVSAALAATGAFAAFWATGFVLGLLDWPLRLIVVPVAVATLATQATPDGRRADRFAFSWLALRLAPRRRSLGWGLPPAGTSQSLFWGGVWVAPDERSAQLRRGRVRGPATISFASEVEVRRVGLGQRRLLARPSHERHRRGLVSNRLAVGDGETLEIRP